MSSRNYRFRRGQLVPGAIARMALGRVHNARHTLGDASVREPPVEVVARRLQPPSTSGHRVKHEAPEPPGG